MTKTNRYSQCGEELDIMNELDRRGIADPVLYDYGAADGIAFSNTRRVLEDYPGSKAFMVEGSPEMTAALLANTKCFGDRVLVASGVVALPDSQLNPRRFVVADLVSTVSEEHEKTWAASVNYRPILAATFDAIDVLMSAVDFTKERCDVLSVDIEGISSRITKYLLDVLAVRPSIIVCEQDSGWDSIMNRYVNGKKEYEVHEVYNTSGNVMLVRA